NSGIPWFTPPSGDTDSDTDYVGWYFNLHDTRARVIIDPLIISGNSNKDPDIATFVSSIPSISACGDASGISWFYKVDICTGAQIPSSLFEFPEDPPEGLPEDPPPGGGGKKYDDPITGVTIIGDDYLLNKKQELEIEEGDGLWKYLFYWQQVLGN
ncbi:MAG: hypothetical protein B6I36_11255, partial [Desulfobacteraceae bacterium 4572_35.1]